MTADKAAVTAAAVMVSRLLFPFNLISILHRAGSAGRSVSPGIFLFSAFSIHANMRICGYDLKYAVTSIIPYSRNKCVLFRQKCK